MESKAPFQIIGTRVVELKYKTYLESGETNPPELDVKYDISFMDGELYQSIIILSIKGKILTKSKKKMMDFTYKFEGQFQSSKSEIDFDLFKKLSEQNGLVTMLHLSRSILYGITALCGLTPGFTLPMFNIQKLNEAHAKIANEDLHENQ